MRIIRFKWRCACLVVSTTPNQRESLKKGPDICIELRKLENVCFPLAEKREASTLFLFVMHGSFLRECILSKIRRTVWGVHVYIVYCETFCQERQCRYGNCRKRRKTRQGRRKKVKEKREKGKFELAVFDGYVMDEKVFKMKQKWETGPLIPTRESRGSPPVHASKNLLVFQSRGTKLEKTKKRKRGWLTKGP